MCSVLLWTRERVGVGGEEMPSLVVEGVSGGEHTNETALRPLGGLLSMWGREAGYRIVGVSIHLHT